MPKISAATLHEHRTETVERLLEAWGELVMTRGYDEVSLSDVAAKAGLARTAIYNYFPDREALLFAWTEREVQRTIARIRDEIAEADTSSQKLAVFVRLQLESFAATHLPPGQEVMRFLRPETYGRFLEHIQPLEQILTDLLAEGVGSREFAEGDPASLVPMVMATIGGERVPLAAKERDLDESTERVTAFLLRALGASKRRRRTKPV